MFGDGCSIYRYILNFLLSFNHLTRGADIFNPLELYEMRNIPKVVKCVLSMGYIATKLGFIPPLLCIHLLFIILQAFISFDCCEIRLVYQRKIDN